MIDGWKVALPLISHRAIHKNLIVFLVAFPIAGLFLFLLFNPLSFTDRHPLVRQVGNYDANTLFQSDLGNRGHRIKKTEVDSPNPNKNYTIHLWMHGQRMKRRFLRSYGKIPKDPYVLCSVRNCMISINDSDVSRFDAVVFHLHQTKGPYELPTTHPPNQVWIFFTDESPYHTFFASKKYSMPDYNGLFNWSMTYRSDSDVPVPYGRTVPLSVSERKKSSKSLLPNYAKTKSMPVAILGSNCGGQNHRWDYVRELKRHVDVDIYGRCGDLKCPGHFTRDCPSIAKYKFYLSFENSNCREYITEKLWWNAYHNDVVPVVMGAPKTDYESLCPPDSFIHVDDFESPKQLANYLLELDRNDTAYNEYFEWKRNYKVVNEHGYFGSPSLHLCRICEHLNKRATLPKTYNDLSSFWNLRKDCQIAQKYNY